MRARGWGETGNRACLGAKGLLAAVHTVGLGPGSLCPVPVPCLPHRLSWSPCSVTNGQQRLQWATCWQDAGWKSKEAGVMEALGRLLRGRG